MATTAIAAQPAVAVTCRRRPAFAHGRALLLHGMASSAAVWETVMNRWPRPWELWSASLPWRLDASPEWSRTGGLARHICDALQSVPGGADLVVAHSFAANLLLELLAHPDVTAQAGGSVHRPSALILVSPFFRRTPEEFTWLDLERFPATFRRVMEAGVAAHARGRLDPRVQREIAARICELVGPYGWAQFLQTYLRTPWLRTDLVDMPCLVLAGTRDFCPPAAESAALAADLAGGRWHAFADAGHFAMAERPDEFLGVVNGFLDSLHPPAVAQTADASMGGQQ